MFFTDPILARGVWNPLHNDDFGGSKVVLFKEPICRDKPNACIQRTKIDSRVVLYQFQEPVQFRC